VYISKISLHNIRGFKSLEFDLDRGGRKFAGWTVFTGSNGAGKSTLLKAIAYCLVPPTAKYNLQNLEFFQRKNVSAHESHADIFISRCEKDDNRARISFGDDAEDYSESFGFWKSGASTSSGIFSHSEVSVQSLYGTSGHSLDGWFSCGYGPFRRITAPKENLEQIQKSKDTERFATLFFEAATLSEVDSWLTKLKFQQLEGSKPAADQLACVLDLMQDSLLPDGFTIDRVDSKGLWLKDSNGVELSWFDMSDGHRVAIVLVADIVRHMIATFGLEGFFGRDEAGKIFIERSGVVLIDEIDAHLHPSWQREIGFWLKRHFPKIQFLVTSHSPIILQAADPNGLFVLPEPGSEEEPRALSDEEYREIIASTTDTALLSEAFGLQNTRSPRAVDNRAEYARLDRKKKAGAALSEPEEADLKRLESFVLADPE
jgi:predicted ATPase